MQGEEERNEDGEVKNSSEKKKKIAPQQMAKLKEKKSLACKSFHKEQAEELAIGMVARNEVLEQLGLKVKEEELMSKPAAREQAESSWLSSTPCSSQSSGYPSRSPSPEGRPGPGRAILEEENRSRRKIASARRKRVHALWRTFVPSARRNLHAQARQRLFLERVQCKSNLGRLLEAQAR